MNMRNKLLGGLGAVVLGLTSPQIAKADEKEDYTEWSRDKINRELQERAVVLNDSNYQEYLGNEDFTGLVLMDSSYNSTERTEQVNRNMEIVYLQLIDKFRGVEAYNGDDLTFFYFDGCKDNGPTHYRTMVALSPTGIETAMFVDGEEVDRNKGGPTNQRDVEIKTEAMSYWIDHILLNKLWPEDEGKEVIILYEGDSHFTEYPRSKLQR